MKKETREVASNRELTSLRLFSSGMASDDLAAHVPTHDNDDWRNTDGMEGPFFPGHAKELEWRGKGMKWHDWDDGQKSKAAAAGWECSHGLVVAVMTLMGVEQKSMATRMRTTYVCTDSTGNACVDASLQLMRRASTVAVKEMLGFVQRTA